MRTVGEMWLSFPYPLDVVSHRPSKLEMRLHNLSFLCTVEDISSVPKKFTTKGIHNYKSTKRPLYKERVNDFVSKFIEIRNRERGNLLIIFHICYELLKLLSIITIWLIESNRYLLVWEKKSALRKSSRNILMSSKILATELCIFIKLNIWSEVILNHFL